jgi:hypothetical protein
MFPRGVPYRAIGFGAELISSSVSWSSRALRSQVPDPARSFPRNDSSLDFLVQLIRAVAKSPRASNFYLREIRQQGSPARFTSHGVPLRTSRT